MERTDEELMLAYQNGDEPAFGLLYQRYSGRIYGYLRAKLGKRSFVDDAFQTTFLNLHRSRRKYSAEFPFAPWLFTICRNAAIDLQRSQISQKEVVDTEAIERTEAPKEMPPIALPELGLLSPERRAALELRYGEDLSFDEIARRLHTSPANIRQLISRTVRQLKKKLSAEGRK